MTDDLAVRLLQARCLNWYSVCSLYILGAELRDALGFDNNLSCDWQPTGIFLTCTIIIAGLRLIIDNLLLSEMLSMKKNTTPYKLNCLQM